MATAFMPGMFNEELCMLEFKLRICKKTVSPVKKVDTGKSSSTDSEMEQLVTREAVHRATASAMSLGCSLWWS